MIAGIKQLLSSNTTQTISILILLSLLFSSFLALSSADLLSSATHKLIIGIMPIFFSIPSSFSLLGTLPPGSPFDRIASTIEISR